MILPLAKQTGNWLTVLLLLHPLPLLFLIIIHVIIIITVRKLGHVLRSSITVCQRKTLQLHSTNSHGATPTLGCVRVS